ncbi:VWA domain-containing protein [bacterium]|nr:VWA domain-containing protein [bacterium]
MDRFFLNPWMLTLATLAGGIVLLYILKLRRVKVPISSTLLWDRSVQDFKANAPWQKLRRNLLMILQILALLLLVFALARPFIFGTALTGGRTVMLIDTSASMLTSDVRPDRLGQAIDAAGTLVADFKSNDEGMVIAAGPTPRILASFTKDKAELLAALRRARDEAGGETNLDAALGLVATLSEGTATRVVIFSDGAVPDLSPVAVGDLRIDFYPLGESGENLAIVNAGARQNPFTDEFELFVALHNYYGEPETVDLTLNVDDDVIDVRTVELNAGQRSEVVLTSLPYIDAPINVTIDQDDPLLEDNSAYIVMQRQMRYKVALCTQGQSILLRQLLESMDQIELYTYEDGALVTKLAREEGAPPPRIDVWIVEGDAPSGIDPTASYLFIDTLNHPFLPVVPGTLAQEDYSADPPVIPTVVGLDRGHPVLRYTRFTDVRPKAMRRTQLQPWGRVLVDASEGPLLVEGSLEGQRTLYLAFDLYDSAFPLSRSFPIFMANAISYLGQSSAGLLGLSAAAGSRVDLIAPLEATRVEVTNPRGDTIGIDLGTRDFTLSGTTEVGVYHLAYYDAGGDVIQEQDLPVSLVNDDESNVAPAGTIRIQGVEEALAGGLNAEEIVGRREVRTNLEFFTWLIGIVLLIMGIEWYLYHTRAL